MVMGCSVLVMSVSGLVVSGYQWLWVVMGCFWVVLGGNGWLGVVMGGSGLVMCGYVMGG